MNITKAGVNDPITYFPYPSEWLNAESEEIAKSIRKWAETESITKRLEHREGYEQQMQALKVLVRDIVLHRLIWPEEMGGIGYPLPGAASTLVRVYEEIGRADPGIGYISAIQVALSAAVVQENGIDDAIKNELCSAFCSNDDVVLFSLILPGFGDVDAKPLPIISGREVQAEVKKKGDGWIINARNARPLNSGNDAYMYALIASMPDGYALVFVPANEPGVKKGEHLINTGLYASRNADIQLKNVKIPENRCIPISDKTYKRLLAWIDLFCGAIAVGSAMNVYEIVKDWADTRVIKGGQRLKDNPMDAAVLAQVAMDIINSRILVHSLARAIAEPDSFAMIGTNDLFVLAESITLQVTDNCLHAVNRAMEMMASAGYAKEWNVEKHWRDLKTMQAYLGGRVPVEMDVATAYYESQIG